MRSFKRLGLGVCLALAQGSLRSHAQGNQPAPPPPPPDFEPPCLVADTSAIYVAHIQDISPSMSDYFLWLTEGSVIASVDSWMSNFFGSLSTGLLTFTQKDFITGDSQDECAFLEADIAGGPINSLYKFIDVNVGSNSENGSHLDALMKAARHFEAVTPPMKERMIVLQTNRLPTFAPTDDLPPYNGVDGCEDEDFPQLDFLISTLNALEIRVLLVVPQDLVGLYQGVFEDLHLFHVSSFGESATQMLNNMLAGMGEVLCATKSTEEPIITVPGTAEPITLPPLLPTPTEATATRTPSPCRESVILELLQIQDVSHSYTQDLATLRASMPRLLIDLKEMFFGSKFALATFSDKDYEGVGYWIDHCYREEVPFTADPANIVTALDNIKILSGWDWHESQLDAILEGVKSQTLGWYSGELDAPILKVLLLATDAGPHVKGDLPGLPEESERGCLYRDYPSFQQIKDALKEEDIVPIFVVTGDVYRLYKEDVMPYLSDIGTVVLLDDPIEKTLDAVENAIDFLCETAVRRL